jgi:uncharacterized membrane protein
MNKRKNSSSRRLDKSSSQKIDFWMSPNRLLGLSDGVIAIAITILAIKLIPLLHDTHGSLWAIRVELYQYAIGFLSLGIYWIVHHHVFHIIKRADGVLVWLNIMFLGFVSLGPFWTAFITANLGSIKATGFLAISSSITFVAILVILFYAIHGHRLISLDLDEGVPKGYWKMILIGTFIIVIGAIFGLYNPDIFGLFSIASAVWFIYMTSVGYKKFYNDKKTKTQLITNEDLIDRIKTDHESYLMNPERISLLTDGVVAIAITLMVLELPIPILGGKEHPNSLGEIAGEFFLIGVGFLALGLYWVIHHHLFHFIKQSDGALMWLNILFLSFAALVPFWIAYINVNLGTNEAMSYYSIAMTLTLLSLLFIWLYASTGHRLVSKDLGKNIISGFSKFLVFILIITIIILVGNIVIPGFKFVSWILSAVFFVYMTATGYKRFIIPNKKMLKIE